MRTTTNLGYLKHYDYLSYDKEGWKDAPYWKLVKDQTKVKP